MAIGQSRDDSAKLLHNLSGMSSDNAIVEHLWADMATIVESVSTRTRDTAKPVSGVPL